MDVDERLRQQGEMWRQAQPSPPRMDLESLGSAQPDARRRTRRRLVVASAAVVVVVTAGVLVVRQRAHTTTVLATDAPSSASTTSTTTPPSAAQAEALAAWAGFPASAAVRPLLVLEGLVGNPASGFTSDAAKDAFDSGDFTNAATLPAGPAQASGYPVIGSADALARLRAAGDHQGRSAPLVITSVQLGSASFLTDRGRIDLPAWLFSFGGVADPAPVLAVASSALFTGPPAIAASPSVGAKLGADGRTLVLGVVGAPAGTGACTADYTADAAGSASAVAVEVHEISHAAPGAAPVACSQVGYSRTVTVRLPDALGARVLVDARTKAVVTVSGQ